MLHVRTQRISEMRGEAQCWYSPHVSHCVWSWSCKFEIRPWEVHGLEESTPRFKKVFSIEFGLFYHQGRRREWFAPSGKSLKASYMGATVAEEGREEGHIMPCLLGLKACHSVLVLVKCWSPWCIHAQGFEVCVWELNLKEQLEGLQIVQEMPQWDVPFPGSSGLHASVPSVFTVRNTSPEPNPLLGLKRFSCAKTNGSWSEKRGHHFLASVVLMTT